MRAPQPYSTMKPDGVQRVERGDEIAGVAAERGGDTALLRIRDVVSLTDVVEAEQLHHDVMNRVLAGLDEGEAVVARIDVQEVRAGTDRCNNRSGESRADRGRTASPG